MMPSAWLLAMALLAGAVIASPQTGVRRLPLRSRVEIFHGSGQWSEVRVDYPFDPAKSALIVCDMWDRHWCSGATLRVAELVKKLDPVLETARRNGITIVHAPSETMSFYANMPQRMRMLALPAVTPPKELNLSSPPLP